MTIKLRTVFVALLGGVLALGCNSSEPAPATPSTAPAPTTAAQTSAAAPKAGATRRVFVSNYKDDTISIVEGIPEMEVRTLPGGDSPDRMAIRTAAPALLAVSNSTGYGVKFIDPATLEDKGFVETSRGAQDVKFSPDGKILYVVSELARDLNFVDVDAMKLAGEHVQFTKKARAIEINADGTRIYVLLISDSGEGAEVVVFDTKARAEIKRIPVDMHPRGFGLGNNGRLLVSASFDESTLSVIDTESLEVIATYEANTGMGLAVHPSKPIAYSTESFDNAIHVIDLETGAVIKTLAAGQFPTNPSLTPDGRYLYVPHEESDSVVKIDTETNEIVAKIAVGQGPVYAMVYEP